MSKLRFVAFDRSTKLCHDHIAACRRPHVSILQQVLLEVEMVFLPHALVKMLTVAVPDMMDRPILADFPA